MKISQIFLCVIGFHLAVIAFLFAAPGCQSGPDAETTGSGGVVGPPQETVVAESNQNYRQQQYTVGGAPIKAESTPQTTRPRSTPTRPSWNLNENQPAEVIEGQEVTVLEPMNEGLVAAGVTTVSPVVETSSYTVKKGDNLTTIARRHDVTLNELMDANGLNRKSVLQVGQVLVIPGASAASYEPPSGDLTAGSAGSVGESASSYTVKSGDTLGAIAKRNGTSVRAIKSANNLSSDTIIVGQTLLIPSGSGAAAPSVSSGASSVSLPEGTYLVQKGDTLGAIAKRYNVKVSELMTENNISDPRALRAGQKLVIPGQGSTSTPAPVAPAPRAKPATTPAPVPAPVPAPQPAPSQPAVIEEYNAELLLENLDDIPAAEVQSTN